MFRTLLFVAALGIGMTGSAWASQCPSDMAEIDAALANNPSLSEAEMTEVKRLRAEGEALHESGQHAQSVETLSKAKAMLGLN